MLTKEQKDKIRTLWNTGLERKDRSLLLQSWELFQAIDPNDEEFERELRQFRNETAIERAWEIEHAVLKIMEEEIKDFTEVNAWLFHEAFPTNSTHYKKMIDFMFAEVAKKMKKSPAIKQVDRLFEDLAYKEIPYTNGGRR